MREEGNIRLFLLDDHEAVRRGVRELLSADADITVVGEAGDATAAMALLPRARPDLALLDVRLPDGSGVEVCREIRSRDPAVKCLMLTSFADDEALFDAIMAGASGYVPKVITGEDLVRAVHEVTAGKSLLDPAAVAELLERLRGGGTRYSGSPGPSGEPERQQDELSRPEREILDLIGEGLTNRQIAERARLSEKAVRRQVASLLAKLGMEQGPPAPMSSAARPRRARGI